MNTSGIAPRDTKCVVLPDPVEAKTAGGLLLPDEVVEKMAWKRQRCTLLACGASAFAEWLDAPTPGDRVFVSQYSGSKIEADDGLTYWIINDEDIIGAIIEGAAA